MCKRRYRIAGNFRIMQIFVLFKGRAVNTKIKAGIIKLPRTGISHGGYGFLALKHEYYNRKISSGGHSAKICTLENFPLQ